MTIRHFAGVVPVCWQIGSKRYALNFPHWYSGQPLKVLAVCLPFVLVKGPLSKPRAIDIRQVRLARLDNQYARTAWKVLKRAEKGKRKKSKSRRARCLLSRCDRTTLSDIAEDIAD